MTKQGDKLSEVDAEEVSQQLRTETDPTAISCDYP